MAWALATVDETTGTQEWLVPDEDDVDIEQWSRWDLFVANVWPCVVQGRVHKLVEQKATGVVNVDQVGKCGFWGPMCCVLCLCCPCEWEM